MRQISQVALTFDRASRVVLAASGWCRCFITFLVSLVGFGAMARRYMRACCHILTQKLGHPPQSRGQCYPNHCCLLGLITTSQNSLRAQYYIKAVVPAIERRTLWYYYLLCSAAGHMTISNARVCAALLTHQPLPRTRIICNKNVNIIIFLIGKLSGYFFIVYTAWQEYSLLYSYARTSYCGWPLPKWK